MRMKRCLIMTKKKSLLFQVLFLLGACGVFMGVLMLTGCGNNSDELGASSPLEAVAFNGDDYFITSNVGNMTNQEAFDLLVQHPEAVFIFLDLVDEILLRGNFEIDYDVPAALLEEWKDQVPNFDEWLIEQNFASEESLLRMLELNELRQATVRDLIEVTDEEIEETFEEWFAGSDYEFDEVRDDIYDQLFAQAAGMLSPEELARLRNEAELDIFNEALYGAYEQYLMMASPEVEMREVAEQSQADVIARVNGVDITIGQVFAALSNRFGLEIVFDELDDMILHANFSVDPDEVYELIDLYRDQFGDEFEEILADAGFESEAALFAELELMLLAEIVVNEEPLIISEAHLRDLHASMGETVSASHILVDEEYYELAVELIAQLQAVDASDFPELFAELAAEHSLCGSAAAGGDLGSWERGQMVAEFDAVVFDELEIGEFTTTPVETSFGFHIIYKTGASSGEAFEEVRDELEAQEIERMRQTGEAFHMIMTPMREAAEVAFTNPDLQARFEYFNAE